MLVFSSNFLGQHGAGTEERARDTGINEEKRERLILTNRIIFLKDFNYFFQVFNIFYLVITVINL
jgi:hypothetical protein